MVPVGSATTAVPEEEAPRQHYRVTFGVLAMGTLAYVLMQSMVLPALGTIQHDLHGYTLHDLCEVAGGVVRRQQRKLRAAGRRQVIDLPSKNHSRKCVYADFSRGS